MSDIQPIREPGEPPECNPSECPKWVDDPDVCGYCALPYGEVGYVCVPAVLEMAAIIDEFCNVCDALNADDRQGGDIDATAYEDIPDKGLSLDAIELRDLWRRFRGVRMVATPPAKPCETCGGSGGHSQGCIATGVGTGLLKGR